MDPQVTPGVSILKWSNELNDLGVPPKDETDTSVPRKTTYYLLPSPKSPFLSLQFHCSPYIPHIISYNPIDNHPISPEFPDNSSIRDDHGVLFYHFHSCSPKNIRFLHRFPQKIGAAGPPYIQGSPIFSALVHHLPQGAGEAEDPSSFGAADAEPGRRGEGEVPIRGVAILEVKHPVFFGFPKSKMPTCWPKMMRLKWSKDL